MANDQKVREKLLYLYQIEIPKETLFIGAMHNTTCDTVEYFDLETISPSFLPYFSKLEDLVERALGYNALERCDRFPFSKNINSPKEALIHVQTRANDLAQIRPGILLCIYKMKRFFLKKLYFLEIYKELNHATNAAVIVGRRELTKNKFLDRRVFLPSYNPLGDDEMGTNLEHVLAPALIVCSGINLEYLFSTIDVEFHGSGSFFFQKLFRYC